MIRNPFNSPKIELEPGFSIEAQDLTIVAEETTVALRGINVAFHPGEYVSITGQNSSGKTTLGNAILGLAGNVLKVTEGTVKYGDLDIYGKGVSEKDRTKLRSKWFGYVPKLHEFDLDMTAAQNIKRPHHLSGRKITNDELHDVAETFGIADRLHMPVRALSSGMRQRVNVARGIVTNPKVLLLDEPEGALDAGYRDWLDEYLASYAKQAGNIVLNITHDTANADRQIVLEQGRLISDIRKTGVAA